MALGRQIGTWGCSDGRIEVAEWLRLPGRTAGGSPSVVELVGQRRVEHEVRYGLGLGGFEGRSLVEKEEEEEVSLRWTASG